MACDHACPHCGSRAARAHPQELSTAESLDVADQLLRLTTREVTLIGGEAYLRPDCEELIAHLHQGGIRVTMQTGGRGVNEDLAGRLKAAGLAAMGVSVDGPPAIHDRLRGIQGSHASAIGALKAAHSVGLCDFQFPGQPSQFPVAPRNSGHSQGIGYPSLAFAADSAHGTGCGSPGLDSRALPNSRSSGWPGRASTGGSRADPGQGAAAWQDARHSAGQ